MIDRPRDPDASPQQTLAPPHTPRGILRQLGPGLIIAGSIVGSGELIGTTKTGAEAGFVLLWLIVIGCVIKVFAQVEFGRYSIVTGNTTMQGLNEAPGPRWRVNWLVCCWAVMFVVTLGQLGGIVGGVGQSLALSIPITGDFIEQLDAVAGGADLTSTRDDIYWAAIVTMITSVLLVMGRYLLIQNVSTFLVAGFTLVTVGCVIAQQFMPEYAVRWSDLAAGMSFTLPPTKPGISPLATALATFGIIGVGANELIAYPYWCLEKGYARSTGPRDASPAWGERARGWMRVMRWDAWCSMVIYTSATLAFYLLGAGVLHRMGLNPSGNQMVRTLSTMYEPTLGAWTQYVFLFGAFAVLYSTFFVAPASHARAATDALRLCSLVGPSEASWRRSVQVLSGVLPFCALGIYIWRKDPVALVLLGGVAQAMMLPLLGFAAVWFRYRRGDARVTPSKLWDLCLWVSFGVLILAGAAICWNKKEDVAGLIRSIGGLFAG